MRGHLLCIEEYLNHVLQTSGQRNPSIFPQDKEEDTKILYVSTLDKQKYKKQYKKFFFVVEKIQSDNSPVSPESAASVRCVKLRFLIGAAVETCETWGRCTPQSVGCMGWP